MVGTVCEIVFISSVAFSSYLRFAKKNKINIKLKLFLLKKGFSQKVQVIAR